MFLKPGAEHTTTEGERAAKRPTQWCIVCIEKLYKLLFNGFFLSLYFYILRFFIACFFLKLSSHLLFLVQKYAP